jgi:hypothetical protein
MQGYERDYNKQGGYHCHVIYTLHLPIIAMYVVDCSRVNSYPMRILLYM